MKQTTSTQDQPKPKDSDTVELHVRRVPRPLWYKLRQAALAKRTSFRAYVIDLLNASTVKQVPPESVDSGDSTP